mgnify:CR=1 FL=1
MTQILEKILNKKYRYVGCSASFCDDAWLISDNEVLYYDLEFFTWHLLKVSTSFRIFCEIEISESEVQRYV